MFHELCAAILPTAGLSYTLNHWQNIAEALIEQPRKRKRYGFC